MTAWGDLVISKARHNATKHFSSQKVLGGGREEGPSHVPEQVAVVLHVAVESARVDEVEELSPEPEIKREVRGEDGAL